MKTKSYSAKAAKMGKDMGKKGKKIMKMASKTTKSFLAKFKGSKKK